MDTAPVDQTGEMLHGETEQVAYVEEDFDMDMLRLGSRAPPDKKEGHHEHDEEDRHVLRNTVRALLMDHTAVPQSVFGNKVRYLFF